MATPSNTKPTDYRSVNPCYNSSVAVAPRSVQSTYTIDNIPITPNPFVDTSITNYLQIMASGFYAAKGSLANIVFEYTGTQSMPTGRVYDATWKPTSGVLWDKETKTFMIQPNTGKKMPLFGTVNDKGHFVGELSAASEAFGTLNALGGGTINGNVYVEPYNNSSEMTLCTLNAQLSGDLGSSDGIFAIKTKIIGYVTLPDSSLNFAVKCVSYSGNSGGLYDFTNQINPQDQFVQTALNSLVDSGLANAPINRLSARYVFTF